MYRFILHRHLQPIIHTRVHTKPTTQTKIHKPETSMVLTTHKTPRPTIHTKPTTPHTGSPKESPPQTHHSKPSERKKEKREAEREREREARFGLAEPKTSINGGGGERRRRCMVPVREQWLWPWWPWFKPWDRVRLEGDRKERNEEGGGKGGRLEKKREGKIRVGSTWPGIFSGTC